MSEEAVLEDAVAQHLMLEHAEPEARTASGLPDAGVTAPPDRSPSAASPSIH